MPTKLWLISILAASLLAATVAHAKDEVRRSALAPGLDLRYASVKCGGEIRLHAV